MTNEPAMRAPDEKGTANDETAQSSAPLLPRGPISPAQLFSQMPKWRAEFKALFSIGVPMALTQFVQFFITTIDIMMIGRLGATPVAAASLALVFYYFVFLLTLGPAMAVSPMISQALGAKPDDKADPRRSVRMGIWVSAFCAVGGSLVFLFVEDIARLFGQPAELGAMARPYALALAPGLPFMISVIVMRNFFACIDRTTVPLYITIGATLINVLLNYMFIYGNFGAPRLELVGAGIASSLSHLLGFAALMTYANWEKTARQFDLFTNFFNVDMPRAFEILRLGWPIGLTMAFEAMLFNACVLLMGRIGVDEVAAYQVALNAAGLAFMIPLGLSMGGGVRVGLMAGARDKIGVQRASLVSMAMCVIGIAIFAIPFAIIPNTIASWYISANSADNAVVLTLIAAFLPIAAAFALFDATQVAAAQALRGLKDVRMPMILTGISYWVIGFPLAVWLGLGTSYGAIGIWWGLLVSLLAAALTLGARLWQITR